MGDEKKYTLRELNKSLNEQQKVFCQAKLFNNNVQSYLIAYPDCEYKSASASATRLLEDARIKQYIEYLKQDIEEITGVSKIKNIAELSKIAYSSIASLHNTWIELEAFESLTDEQKAAIESIETKIETKQIQGKDFEKELFDIEVKYVKIKLYSKLQAIESINKMMGYNEPEKHSHDLTINDYNVGFKDEKDD